SEILLTAASAPAAAPALGAAGRRRGRAFGRRGRWLRGRRFLAAAAEAVGLDLRVQILLRHAGGVRGPGTDVRADPRPQIQARHVAFLRLRVDDLRLLRIDAALESVAAADVVSVARTDAGAVERARGAADRPVVLRAAAHVIEGTRVVGGDAIELRQR